MCRYQGKQNMQDVVVWLEQGSFPVKLVLPCKISCTVSTSVQKV